MEDEVKKTIDENIRKIMMPTGENGVTEYATLTDGTRQKEVTYDNINGVVSLPPFEGEAVFSSKVVVQDNMFDDSVPLEMRTRENGCIDVTRLGGLAQSNFGRAYGDRIIALTVERMRAEGE